MCKPILSYNSIADAARAAGLDRQNLHKMLRGKENPTVQMCFRLARAWQTDIDTILEMFYPDEMQDLKRNGG